MRTELLRARRALLLAPLPHFRRPRDGITHHHTGRDRERCWKLVKAPEGLRQGVACALGVKGLVDHYYLSFRPQARGSCSYLRHTTVEITLQRGGQERKHTG